MTMKVTLQVALVADVSVELLQPFLQHIRDFDIKHPGCHFEIVGDMQGVSVAEMLEKLRVNPNLKIVHVVEP